MYPLDFMVPIQIPEHLLCVLEERVGRCTFIIVVVVANPASSTEKNSSCSIASMPMIKDSTHVGGQLIRSLFNQNSSSVRRSILGPV